MANEKRVYRPETNDFILPPGRAVGQTYWHGWYQNGAKCASACSEEDLALWEANLQKKRLAG